MGDWEATAEAGRVAHRDRTNFQNPGRTSGPLCFPQNVHPSMEPAPVNQNCEVR